MAEHAGKPKVRFAGFTETWEQRNTSYLGNFFKGQGYSKADLLPDGTPIILYGQLYTNYQFTITEVNTYAQKKKNTILSKGNEVIVPASGETAEDIARASAVRKKGVILGGDLNIIVPIPSMNAEFFALSLSNGFPQKKLAQKAQGKSVVHIHNSDIQEISITYPSLEEQNRIASFFRHLDRLITLHQRKRGRLENIKKAMLEKMFPKNGADVPEVRFVGFTEAWEQRKLGEIAEKTFGGGTPSTSNPDFWSGKIPWIQSSDLTEDNLFDVKPRKFISKLAIKSSASKIIPKNSIAIIVRVGVGKLAFLPFNYSTSQDFLSITEINVDELFALYSIYKKLKKDLSLVQGTSIKGITKEELLRKTLFIPIKKSEQARIGAFFRHLDRLITLHQRKVALLQNIKKACLEKMFV